MTALPAADVELLGEYQGSGHVEAPWLVRRADGRTVSVSRVLYAVLAACDGRTSHDTIALRVSAEVGRRLTADQVAHVIDRKLAPLGLLQGCDSRDRRPAFAAPLLSLWFRVPLMPARWVNGISRALGFLFAPALVIVTLVALVAVDVWLFGTRGVQEIFGVVLDDPLVLAIVTPLSLLGACFHELGHATACRKGGARPGVIGVGAYLWWFVMFNDLTDTYRLDRRGRLRADLGGVYFNVVFVVGLFAAYLATGYEPLLVVMLFAHADIAAQFWPFVRLDGYYVMSDLTGVPDLFGMVRPVLRSAVRRGAVDPALAGLRPRVRWVVTAWVVSTVLALGSLCVWLAVAGPALARDALAALLRQVDEVGVAFASGDLADRALAVTELVLLGVPVVGAVLTAGFLLLAGVRALGDRRVDPRTWSRRAGPALDDDAISWRDWDAVVARHAATGHVDRRVHLPAGAATWGQ